MKLHQIISVFIILLLGHFLGNSSFQPRTALAQQNAEPKPEWILIPIQKGTSTSFDACLYSPQSGEAFALAERNKIQVKLK